MDVYFRRNAPDRRFLKSSSAIESGNVYICLLENGQRQPSLNAVLLLAAKLGIPAEELVRRVCVELEKGTDAAP